MEPTGRPLRDASLVYRLTDAVEKVCWFAELQWSRDPGGGEVFEDPDVVEARLERVVQLADDLRAEVADGPPQNALSIFAEGLDRAWGVFQEAWGQSAHREALRVWDEPHAREGECPAEVRQAIVGKSPALRQFQDQVRGGFQSLLAALPEELRLLAEVCRLLARPEYPGAAYDRVIEEAGVSPLRYLRRVLRRQVAALWPDLLRHFPVLADLDMRIDGRSEYDCLDSVSRLRERLGRGLTAPRTRVETRAESEPPVANPVDEPGHDAVAPAEVPTPENASGGLTFEPGAFVYRGRREPLNGKPLQVLQALAQSRGKVRTLKDLQDTIWKDVSVGEEAIRSAVRDARKALRRAMRDAGVEGVKDPIPTVDRGPGRTAWRLELP